MVKNGLKYVNFLKRKTQKMWFENIFFVNLSECLFSAENHG